MGMFDRVACEYPLPGGPGTRETDFHTKDLGERMNRYVITEDGRFAMDLAYHVMIQAGNWNSYLSHGLGEPGEKAPTKDELRRGARTYACVMETVLGCTESYADRPYADLWIFNGYHGEFRFDINEEINGELPEYRVRFEDGRVVELEYVGDGSAEWKAEHATRRDPKEN